MERHKTLKNIGTFLPFLKFVVYLLNNKELSPLLGFEPRISHLERAGRTVSDSRGLI